jgi:hypothetical protein
LAGVSVCLTDQNAPATAFVSIFHQELDEMMSPNRPTSRVRLFSICTIRLTVLLSVVAIAATVLASTSSSARSLGQRLITAMISGGPTTPSANAAPANQALAFESEAAAPIESSTLIVERRGHTATRLPDGRVLIAGGENSSGALNETELYDSSSGTFSAAANMSVARIEHTATLLGDGRVLIAGGRNAGGSLSTTEIFDPATGVFTNGPSMSVARAGHSATLFANGRVFIAGGDSNGSAEILDVAAGTSTAAGSMSAARSLHSAALLQDGRVLIVGGKDANGNALSTGEIFDTPAGSFSTIGGTLKVGRVQALLRVLFDGKVQIVGGSDDGSMEIYDPLYEGFGAYAHVLPEGDTCTGLPGQIQSSQTRAALFHNGQTDATFDRSSHSISELSSQAIVIGGVNSNGTVLSSTPVFNSSAAAISTDKLDYAPGETAYITGRGFQAGETVRLKIHEDPHTPQERGMDVVADGDGSFVAEYLVMDYDLDMKFIVGSRGLTSGRTAQTTFTDSQPTSVTLTPSSVSIAPGNSAVYGVSIVKGGNNSLCTLTLSLTYTGTAPVGTTPSFVPNSLSMTNADVSSTLTITTTNTGPVAGRTQPGTYNFTVSAAKGTGCQGSTSPVTTTGTLIVANPNVAPVASAVSISGTAEFNQLLTGNYTYSDADGDAQGTSTFRWLRNGTTVVGTNQTYTTVSADVGQTLTFEVTPVALTGTSPGAPVTSAGVAIGKAPSTTTINCPASVTYNGAAQTPCSATATGTGGLNVPVSVVYGNNTNAGTATADATYAGDANHNSSVATQVTFTIDKAGSSTTVNCPTNVTYNGSPQTPCSATATGAGGLNVSVSVVYGNNTNAGTATADATYAGDANHNSSVATQVTFTIDKAGSSTSINCPTNVTYNGSPQTPCSATATGAGGLNVSVSVVYGNNTNAGTATADATYAGDANHNSSVATQVTFTIDKAGSSTSINCPTNVTYNGSPQTPCSATATGAGGLNVSVSVVYGNNTNAGTATADATYAGDANHNSSVATQVTFTIDKAGSSTSINCPTNVTYNGSPQTPCSATATGAGGLNVSVSVVYGNNTNAGTATADATYIGDDNHNSSVATQVTFTIDKAGSSTSINCPTNVTYNGSPQTPCTATATGAGGLNVSVSLVYGNNTNAGTATADATYAGDDNHNSSVATQVTFTIDKRTLTAAIAGNPTKVYDGNTSATLTSANFSIGNLVPGQSITVTKTAGTYNTKDVATANNVSTTLMSGDFSAGAGTNLNNYNLPTSASGAGHITTKALAITADDKSFLFGTPLATLTPSFNAFVAGEGVSNLSGTLTFTLKDALNNTVPYNASTPAGTYVIVPGGVTSTNYNITFVNGTLTIGAWSLMGFYQPVDMSSATLSPIIWNSIKGGSTVPLKFNIFANGVEKKALTDIQGFSVAEIPCSSSGYTTDVEFTTTGGTSLRYDTTAGQFIQNWQTPKAPGRCYQTRITALDGSHLDAFFKSK